MLFSLGLVFFIEFCIQRHLFGYNKLFMQVVTLAGNLTDVLQSAWAAIY